MRLSALVEHQTEAALMGVEPLQLRRRLALMLVLHRSNWGPAWRLHAWTVRRTWCDSPYSLQLHAVTWLTRMWMACHTSFGQEHCRWHSTS